MITRRLSYVQLDTQVSDPVDRQLMPMSTLISVDADPPNLQWLLETTWDGSGIGDVQVFKNRSVGHNGIKTAEKDDWVWWGGVPRGKIRSYRFSDGQGIQPTTVGSGQRKEEPRQVDKAGQQVRA
jgi:hypothetical protein